MAQTETDRLAALGMAPELAKEVDAQINSASGGGVAWADVSGKPATFPPVIGTTATTAKAGNSIQTAAQTTATAIAPGTATNVQAILAELAARITDLENA